MAKSTFSLEDKEMQKLAESIQSYPDYAGQVINDVLWNKGGALIQEGIMPLLPTSGRTWRGKKPAAKTAAPFTQENASLSVTVKTKNGYHYLYFPDDGSNTRKHAGNQQFMLGGAEAKQGEIIDLCIVQLTQPFN